MARVGAIVLAAGDASRFGGVKVLAQLGDRPILQHVLDAVADAGLAPVVVVLGGAAEQVERAIGWRAERRVVNPAPEAGLSGSLRLAFEALAPGEAGLDAVLIVLGDQPRAGADALRALAAEPLDALRPILVPRYAGGDNPNPVRLEPGAWRLVDDAGGDRGLGPLIAARADLVREVRLPGSNVDVDTPADLATLAWGDRVRADREQVDRCREVPDVPDFYGPLTARFVDDPRRTDDPILEALGRLTRPTDVWLDIGAGAGRFALPLALRVREVVALDPSEGMLAALSEGMARHEVRNVRAVQARWPVAAWPPPGIPPADVALIANVGYDIEEIGPFLEAMEASASRMCVAVLAERQPSSIAAPYWPPVHGEPRVMLPALGEFLDLLAARGTPAEVTYVERPPRGYPDRESLAFFVRGQLWLEPGGAKDRLLATLLERDIETAASGFVLRAQRASRVGVAHWTPGFRQAPAGA